MGHGFPLKSRKDVLDLVEWILDPEVTFFDESEISDLAPDLPYVSVEQSDSARAHVDAEQFRSLPPPLRVAAIFLLFRQQYHNGGVDQFVWNYCDLVPAVIEGFVAVGAVRTASLLEQLLGGLVAEETAQGDKLSTPVAAFMSFRERSDGPAFGPWLEFDPIDEVASAILAYAQEHPDEFVNSTP